MSSFAPVVPVHIAKALQHSPFGDLFGNYHLLLAHDILDHHVEYFDLMAEMRRLHRDYFVIVDNSLIELGHSMSMQDLVRATQLVSADCLVMPDTLSDGARTRSQAEQFIRSYLTIPSYQRAELLGVIQGTSYGDAFATYTSYRNMGIRYMSVPRVIAQREGSRVPLLEFIENANRGLVDPVKIHLLGFSDDILDDINSCRYDCVMGIDSAVPVRTALVQQCRMRFDKNIDYGKRGDFWNAPAPESGNWQYVADNLINFRRLIK